MYMHYFSTWGKPICIRLWNKNHCPWCHMTCIKQENNNNNNSKNKRLKRSLLLGKLLIHLCVTIFTYKLNDAYRTKVWVVLPIYMYISLSLLSEFIASFHGHCKEWFFNLRSKSLDQLSNCDYRIWLVTNHVNQNANGRQAMPCHQPQAKTATKFSQRLEFLLWNSSIDRLVRIDCPLSVSQKKPQSNNW